MEKVRKLDGGIVQARCPACAEAGQDRKGEHLRILPDGRFGCCVHPKDGDHRRKIFALAGERQHRLPSSEPFSIRVAGAKPTIPELHSVKVVLTTVNLGTPGTGKSKSEYCAPNVPEPEFISLGTPGTPWFNPYAYRKDSLHICKDNESGVPGVPSGPEPEVLLPPAADGERQPFLTPGGDLSIPFDSPERYHWWKGGQRLTITRAEVLARIEAERVHRDG